MAASSAVHSSIDSSKIDEIVSRIERLPISGWHVKARVIIGVATFFDAFDALAIAFVLPVLVPLWKLTRPADRPHDFGRLFRPTRWAHCFLVGLHSVSGASKQ